MYLKDQGGTEMIKHEEARDIIKYYVGSLVHDKILRQYITEQEKKDELLELYRELVDKEEEYNTSDNTIKKK